MVNPVRAQPAITPVMGKLVPLLNTLTSAAASEARPICKAPNNAEALPASFEKGAKESAEELGKLNPWQQRNKKMSEIELYKVSQLKKLNAHKISPNVV